MSILPEIESPIYTITLPVSNKTIKFRPYKVKEHKLLMMATEAQDETTLVDTIHQIISNCVLSEINTRELCITDIEYIFYQLRARSESEIVKLTYKCENIVEGKSCDNLMNYDLNLLTDLEVSKGHDSVIQLTDKIGIKLKNQKFEVDPLNNKEFPTPDELFEIAAKNVEFIFDENSSYQVSDLPIKAVVDFLSDLSTKQYEKIEEFFLNEPRIHKNIEIKCKKCGMVHKLKVEDIFDFFI